MSALEGLFLLAVGATLGIVGTVAVQQQRLPRVTFSPRRRKKSGRSRS